MRLPIHYMFCKYFPRFTFSFYCAFGDTEVFFYFYDNGLFLIAFLLFVVRKPFSS